VSKRAVKGIMVPDSCRVSRRCLQTGWTFEVTILSMSMMMMITIMMLMMIIRVHPRTEFRTKQMICVPVFDLPGHIAGVIQCINTPNDEPFTHEDEDLLRTVAEQLGQVGRPHPRPEYETP
jgi:hypothetical protein